MKAQAVLVVGMHRSGTSALSGVLGGLGVFMGQSLHGPQKGVNEKGFWENAAVVSLNEELFDALLWSWDSPDAHAIDGHLATGRLGHQAAPATALVEREYAGQALWGFKDPRVSVLLPFWQEILENARIASTYILMLRDPLEVAASLAARDEFSAEKSLTLWLNYSLSSYWCCQGHPTMLLTYERLLAEPLEVSRGVCEKLGLATERAEAAASFIAPGLRHQKAKTARASDSKVAHRARAVYEELSGATPSESVLRRLTTEHLDQQAALDPMLIEHIRQVKRDEVRFRHLFEEAYGSIWWKLAYPMRWLERAIRRTFRA